MAEARAPIKTDVMEGIALVTFNAPTQNVATVDMWDALATVLHGCAADDAIRVVVLTGAGHHAFVSDPVARDAGAQASYDAAALRALAALAAFPKPVVARVRGNCLGTGLILALHADLLIAGEDSTFSLPGARWGATYPPAAVATLTRLVGPQHAKRLLFAGARMGAREALRIGLVTLVVDDADLSDIVVDLARDIADNAPLAVAAAKRMVASAGEPGLDHLVADCLNSRDYAIGLAASQHGTPPVFEGT